MATSQSSNQQSNVNSILLDFESPKPKLAKSLLQAINDADYYVRPDDGRSKMIAYKISEILQNDHEKWDDLMHVFDGERVHIPGFEPFIGHMVAYGVIAGIMLDSKHGIRIDPSVPIPEAIETSRT